MRVLRKEIMRAGNYQMGNGQPFLVTRDRIRHWAETFRQMNDMKINVPTCKDHQCDAEHTVGRISSMEALGDSLYAVMEFPREQEAELARTNDVSVATRDQLITGVGTFQDAIEHVALTPRPVVPGLAGYSLICSLGDIQQPSQPDTSNKDGNAQTQTPGGATSSYALQKAMEIVSSIFGIAIPPEATRSEEAAIAYLSTVQACKQAGMIQEQKAQPAPPAAPPAPAEPAEPSEPDDQSKPEPPADQDQTQPQDGEGNPTDEPGENPPDDQDQNPDNPDQNPDQNADQDGVNDNTNTPENPEEDEEKKKKKTPGEDGIIASLNEFRRMKIESLLSTGGIRQDQVKGQIAKFCSCRDQGEYFASLNEFESFREGLELSLTNTRPGIAPNMLTATLTGPQLNGGDGKNPKREPAFVQMARSASKSKSNS